MAVFDRYIAQMREAPHLLTEENREHLSGLLPLPASPDEITDASNLVEMGKVLQKMIRIAERMYTDAISSTGDDQAGDMKATANALKQVMDVAIRYTDKINASDRAIKVENALVAALNEFAVEQNLPGLIKLFNQKLKAMLA